MSNEEQQIKQLTELNVEMRIIKQNFASITKKIEELAENDESIAKAYLGVEAKIGLIKNDLEHISNQIEKSIAQTKESQERLHTRIDKVKGRISDIEDADSEELEGYKRTIIQLLIGGFLGAAITAFTQMIKSN